MEVITNILTEVLSTTIASLVVIAVGEIYVRTRQ